MQKDLRMNNRRNSSIEILRIIAMLFIVFSHYSVHGGFDTMAMDTGINKYLLQNMFLGSLGTDIFILISGYFIVKSSYSFKKVIQLVMQVFFYSFCIYAIFIITGIEKFNFRSMLESLFPTIFNQYWFFTAYTVFYILSPYINIFLNRITRKTHLMLILTMLVLWSLITTLTGQEMYGDPLLQFFMLYLIGAYIRLYPDCLIMKKHLGAILAIVCTVILLVYKITVMDIYVMAVFAMTVFSRTSFLIIGISVGLLVIFVKMKPRYPPFINSVASCVFGIYLIHDNHYMKTFLWQTLLKNYTYSQSGFLIVHMLICVISVFIICIVIEMARNKLTENPIMKLVNKNYDRWSAAIKSTLIKLYKKITSLV